MSDTTLLCAVLVVVSSLKHDSTVENCPIFIVVCMEFKLKGKPHHAPKFLPFHCNNGFVHCLFPISWKDCLFNFGSHRHLDSHRLLLVVNFSHLGAIISNKDSSRTNTFEHHLNTI